MYNNDTELLFPSRVLKDLIGIRGDEFDDLLKVVIDLPEKDPDHLAMVLMMTKLNGCLSCNSDSFRAMRGCTQCSILNVRRYRGSEKQLNGLYVRARKEITRVVEARYKSEG
ncbi:MAG: hypothetical protein JW757_01615 [Anaerolineales bacterium]|nr:hypothetical protein [Anaerolineales bacterium]